MATSSSTITSYDWSTNSEQLFSYLKRVAENEQILDRSDQVLTSLSAFINPLITVSSHPLLNKSEFYVQAEILFPKLNPTIASLRDNEIFNGCRMLADEEAEEGAYSPINPTLSLRTLPKVLDKSQAPYVLSFLKGCADNIQANRGSAFTKEHLSRCEMIFQQIQGYLQTLEDIFACPVFKQEDFYAKAFQTIPEDDHDNVQKISKLFVALMADQINSRGTTPSTTPTLHRSPFRKSASANNANEGGHQSNQTANLQKALENLVEASPPASPVLGAHPTQPTNTGSQGEEADDKTPLLHPKEHAQEPANGPCCCVLL